MPTTDLVAADIAAAADADRARLDHEAAVLGRMLGILEQARHQVLASAPPPSEFGPVVARKCAERHDQLAEWWREVCVVKDRTLAVALGAATEGTEGTEHADAPAAARFVPAVDLGGWLARMDDLREANRAAVTVLRVPADTRCEGWCRQPCPRSEMTEVEAEGHTVRLCPACAARLAGLDARLDARGVSATQAKAITAPPAARTRAARPPKTAPSSGAATS